MKTNFSCSEDSNQSCPAYVAYFARPLEFMNLINISDLFGVSPISIARSSNLVSEENPLVAGQLLLVPILCGCSGNHYFANITYQIKKDDTYFLVSTTSFGNLTNWHVVEKMNPSFNATSLQIGVQVVFPVFCKCPSKTQLKNESIEYFITYVWQPNDDISHVSTKFNASQVHIRAENRYENFSDATDFPILVPVSQLPILSQPDPIPKQNKLKHKCVISVFASAAFTLLISIFLYSFIYTCHLRKKKGCTSCSLDLVQAKELKRGKIIQDKLLPGVSGYLSKPIMYETKAIMEATFNFNDNCRIGGSVYKATIDGEVLAVKKVNKDVTEELRILQKVNHANLVKLMGISSDYHGHILLVYEYAENGSLDKWLHSKSSSSSSSSSDPVSFLTWNQRLNIALDVASGLQYMHDHIEPSLFHRDINTSNILLDSRFKAKISNLSMAWPATNCLRRKVDVFAFGIVLVELLSGKRAIQTKNTGGVELLWKDLRVILEVEEKREERLRNWMDPNLESFYPIDSAVNLAALAKACTLDRAMARPTMAEIVFNLSLLVQASSETFEGSSVTDAEDHQLISRVKAR